MVFVPAGCEASTITFQQGMNGTRSHDQHYSRRLARGFFSHETHRLCLRKSDIQVIPALVPKNSDLAVAVQPPSSLCTHHDLTTTAFRADASSDLTEFRAIYCCNYPNTLYLRPTGPGQAQWHIVLCQ